MEGLNSICGDSPFWNTSLLMDGDYPQFTDCFMNTALVWGPCGLLWVVLPFYLLFLSRYGNGAPVPLQVLNVSKMLMTLLLCAFVIVQLVHQSANDETTTAAFISHGVRLATYVLTVVLSQIERRHGRIISPVLFVFWFLVTVSYVIPFYTALEEELIDSDELEFAMLCASFGAVIVLFLLYCFAEKRTRRGYEEVSKLQSKEITASMLSILTFAWLDSTIWSGFKNRLNEDTVHDLHPDDKTGVQVPIFKENWDKEKERVHALNAQLGPIRTSHRALYSSVDEGVGLQLSGEKAKGRGHGRGRRRRGSDERTKLLGDSSDSDNNKKSEPQTISLLRVLFKTFGFQIAILQIFKTCFDLMSFVTPKITEALLNFVGREKTETDMWKGYVLAMSYFVVNSFTSICNNQILNRNKRISMHIQGTLMCTVYKKSLTMSNEATKTSTTGEIVNLMSIDSQRIANSLNFLYVVVSAPFQIAIALYMLYDQLGVATFVGLAVYMLLLPANVFIVKFIRKYNTTIMKLKDKRIRLMNEVLSGFKVLKLYAWENSFFKKVSEFRAVEVKNILKLSLVMACLTFVFGSIPYFVQVASFGTYISIEGYLDPTTAYVSINLFNQLMMAMNMMPYVIPMLIQTYVSITRIGRFLNQPDVKPDVYARDPNLVPAIKIDKGTFTWDKEQEVPTLQKINLEIKQGSLVAVVGMVGSGKSSLLSAMIGEMNKLKGTVTVKTDLAYVPQEAWIQNATMRDNILFGKSHKHSKYEKVIDACALRSDLKILAGGDFTEIGEKGINISGGQKQRVSLARAVYSDSDIYLFDDPLSAVDSHVGKHIFENVLSNNGLLQGKTRVLVTHGIHWLPMVDTIVVMKDGQISETGSYEELISRDGDFAQFLKEFFITEKDMEEDEEITVDPEVKEMRDTILQRLESVTGASSAEEVEKIRLSGSYQRRRSTMTSSGRRGSKFTTSTKEAKGTDRGTRREGRLVEDEDIGTGTIKTRVYMQYLRMFGWLAIVFSLSLYAIYMGCSLFSSIWLSTWTDDQYLANTSLKDTQKYKDKTTLYLSIYGTMGAVQGCFSYAFAATVLVRMTRASASLHNLMLANIFRAPMSFFDTTPIGRIVNRFSRDVDVIDTQLPNNLRQSVRNVGQVLTSLISMAYSTPIILCVIIPIMIIYTIMQRIYIPAARQIRRINATTQSPIYVHFSETLTGIGSIRAYGAQDRFEAHSKKLVDHNLKFFFLSQVTGSWLSFRLEFLGNLIVLAAAIFAVQDVSLTAGLAGLSVTYAQQVTNSLRFLIQTATQLETNVVSVERVTYYSEIPNEADWEVAKYKPPPDWPAEGDVQFDDLQIRYREGLELVLKGISCRFLPGQKVGVVGRTGAGKTSLTVALFRLVEAAAGKIEIDGRNTSLLGLHDLRSKITILPQDPVVFAGSIRMNLDPSEQHSDQKIWEALEHAHLKTFVHGLSSQLDYDCGEGGQNLSVGQRQLLCLARALLINTKVLVLDEATAAVDVETDDLIQHTLRTEFKESTVLTIAHRLQTILDYDKVMVMDKGNIIEMDSPNELLKNPESVFYSMAKSANLV